MKRHLAALIALLITLSSVVCAVSFSTTAESDVTVYHSWDFEDGINGWGDSLSSSVQLTYTQEVAETNALAFDFTYNATEVGNWNNCPIFSSPTYMGTIGESTKIRFDVYLEKGKATQGSIEVYPIIQSPQHNYWFQLPLTEISAVSGGEELENGLIKYTITSDLTDASGNPLASTDTIHVLTFCNCGKFTDYSGKIYYDNIQFISVPEEPEAPTELTVSTALKGAVATEAGDAVTVTCNAQGGTAPYRYTFYAIKDGAVEYKSDIWTGINTAKITLNEVGTYKIMTYCRDTTGKKLSVRDKVTVYSEVVKPSGITLSETSVSIERGKTVTVTATVSPSDAMDKTVEWTSDNTAIAKVDQDGVITAVSVGSAVITATTSNGFTAKVNVTVTVPTATKYIALTFDDGPDGNTGEILDILKEKDAKATFFVLYKNAQYNSSLIKRAAEEGHEIGNHTKTHPYLTQISQAEALEEINFVNDFVEQSAGVTPTLYRPPYLAYNNDILSLFPEMTAVGCSIDPQDWAGKSASEITSKVLDTAKNGDIVLLHVNMSETRKALPDIIDGLHEAGFECVTVSELFEANNVSLNVGKYYSSIYY